MLGLLGPLLGLRKLAGDIARKVPGKVWAGLAVLALILGLIWWHGHSVDKARKAGEVAGRAAADAEWKGAVANWRAAARDWKRAHDSRAQTINAMLEKRHAEDIAANAAAADDLRLRGPGAARACAGSRSSAGLAGSPGRHVAATGPADAPPGRLPAPDRETDFAIVPWGWLVRQAEEKDNALAEARAWRTWHDEQGRLHRGAIDQLRRQWPEPKFGKE